MFAPEFFQQGVNLHTDLGIEAGGGFVQENKLRIVDLKTGPEPTSVSDRPRACCKRHRVFPPVANVAAV